MEDKCHKTRYANETEANNDLEKIKRTSTRSSIPIRAYFCPICSNWHLTSQQPYTVTKLKAISKELEDVKAEHKRVIAENKSLIAENKVLRDRNSQEATKFIRRDQEIITLNQTILKKNKTIKVLMNDNSGLISKIIALRKNRENPKTPPHSI